MLKFKSFFIFIFSVIIGFQSFAQEKNYITKKFNEIYSQKSFHTDVKQWRERELANVKARVSKLSAAQRTHYISRANEANKYEWPSITASLYLDYKNTGQRIHFERLHNKREEMISALAIGSLITDDNTYIPQLVNGLWLVLEESTWVAPAHIVVQKEGADLPGVNTQYIDLHASRTAYRVALIQHLLQDKLQKYSKAINNRILAELDERIFQPYLKYDNFFWMGLKGGKVNNWNTFNNANCFGALVYALPSAEVVDRLAPKIILSADAFLNHYPADGGCDEGPSYWDMAGGRMINLLSQLRDISEDSIDFKDNQRLHNIGTYTYKMHISDNWFTNFADAFAIYTQNPVSIMQFGALYNDHQLKQYASFAFNQLNQQMGDDIIDFVGLIKVYEELQATPAKAPYLKYAALPNLEVFIGRQKEGSPEGLFFAIKGGHNNESHNHNDVGNFIVYQNGEPLLIDVGVGTYTAKTFSKQRYELWNVQSNWHNCPTINGFDQKNGREYAASNLKEANSNTQATISLNIGGAYPKEAAIDFWSRELNLNRTKKQVVITEKFALKKALKNNELNYISKVKPTVKSGELNLNNVAVLAFDAKQFEVEITEKILDDERFVNSWGEKIYQIKLVAKQLALTDTYRITIRQI